MVENEGEAWREGTEDDYNKGYDENYDDAGYSVLDGDPDADGDDVYDSYIEDDDLYADYSDIESDDEV